MQIVVNPNDVNRFSAECARLHKEIFPSYHLTARLSENVLRLYYLDVLKHAHKSCFILNGSDQVIGFGILSFHSISLMNILRHNLLDTLFFTLLNIPSILLIYFRKKNIFKSAANLRLISIACKNESCHNTSSNLFEMLIHEEICPIGLTVNVKNIRALNFYIKKGFKIENVYYDKFNMIKKVK